MERKPIITYAGNVLLFSSLETHLVNGLPLESIEWRRSYGRAPKTVTLEADFTQFQRERVFKNADRRLIGLPILHTFWTDCPDLDYYKTDVKEAIGQWLGILKAHNNPDWLVVVVEGVDSSRKGNKLLPRATVIDKIRGDFASKHPDRCLAIFDPSKADSRAAEAWQTLLFRMRQLSLAGLTRVLGKFEEDMRSLRERRVDPAWEFCQYFLMQEELALVYEMLGLDEDALVQYDELDALFSQFIINAGAGGPVRAVKIDVPNWMQSFCQPPENWDGVRLAANRAWGAVKHRGGGGGGSSGAGSSPVGSPVLGGRSSHEAASRFLDGVRTDIIENDVSLLQFRNYLFSRQCSLLLGLGRPGEVAQRTLPFLQTCRQELHVLKIEMPQGSLACWGVLSVLEILLVCQSYCEEDVGLAETLCRHTAPLWGFAKNQLLELGQLCGLMPDKQKEPTSGQLHLVVQLIAGISDDDDAHSPFTATSASPQQQQHAQRQCPQERLKEAISSKDGFNRHFLELCELAMGTYKHVGRLRAAREIGLDLANFYMRMKLPARALPFYVEACAGYAKEGWGQLAADARLKIAQCAKTVPDHERYLKTLVLLASSDSLPEEKRVEFQKEIKSVLPKLSAADRGLSMNAEDVLQIEVVRMLPEPCRGGGGGGYKEHRRTGSQSQLVADSEARAEVVLRSRLPLDVPGCLVSLKLRHQPVPLSGAAEPHDGGHSRGHHHLPHPHPHSHSNSHGLHARERRGSHANASPSHSPSSSLSFQSSGHSSRDGDPALPADHNEDWSGPVTLETFQLRMIEHLEHKLDQSVSMAGIGCQNFSRLLRRKDSVPLVSKARLTSTNSNPGQSDPQHHQHQHEQQQQDGSSSALEASAVTLLGCSRATCVVVSAKLAEKGRYTGLQLVVSAFGGRLDLLFSPGVPFVNFCVYSEPASVSVDEATKGLVAGVEQEFFLLVRSGTLNVAKGEVVVLKPSRGLELRLPGSETFADSVSVALPEMKPFSDVRLPVVGLCGLGNTVLRETGNSLQHRISVVARWPEPVPDLELSFERPFSVEHRVHAACERKLVRVTLRALSDAAAFVVSGHSLRPARPPRLPRPHEMRNGSSGGGDGDGDGDEDAANAAVLRMLNPADQELFVSRDHAANYVWELDVDGVETLAGAGAGARLKLDFTCAFKFEDSDGPPRRFSHVFELTNFRTLFAVRAAVEPAKGSEFCRAGAMCVMNISIQLLYDSQAGDATLPPPRDLMYEVLTDPASWAANGRTSGVLSFESGRRTYEASLELMPLRGGPHALPAVRLSKYLAAGAGGGGAGAGTTLARVEPFAPGQIYDFSRGTCVHVLPPASHHHHRHPSGSNYINSAHSSLDAFA